MKKIVTNDDIISTFSKERQDKINREVLEELKRDYGIKDYSNIFPGHGGILDRFDSVIYVSLGLSLILSII